MLRRVAVRAYEEYGPEICRSKVIVGLLADELLEAVATELLQ